MRELFVELLFALIVIAFLNNAVVEGRKATAPEPVDQGVQLDAALASKAVPAEASSNAPVPAARPDFL